jgi:predicted ATPase/DNA-binding winged helix-turn-helix (wHTH) protein
MQRRDAGMSDRLLVVGRRADVPSFGPSWFPKVRLNVSDQPTPAGDITIAFGPFRLLPTRQLLLEGEKPLRLGSRALEILKTLTEQPGAIVSKDDLVARVWPNTFVEEGNLRVHMAALRRALGDGHAGNRFIATVPGRGYSFVAPVSYPAAPEPPPRQTAWVRSAHNLPVSLTRIVGRSDVVGKLATELPQRRFITIVGPGGIGKTTVAIGVADELSVSYRDGIRFVDLAAITDPQLVPSALASVLGVAIRSDHPLPGLIAFLRDKQMLLVLDSCERVVEAAASLAEEVFSHAHGVHILATSREPLWAEGERVHRLPPLDPPAASPRFTASEAMTYSAIQLFVERATASSDEFRLTDANASMVADICRRLDGIPLAIELAAGRIDALGVQGLASRLDDRFRLLTRGRRTALPRHQTLGATLDWSYELLPEPERVILRRLAIFAGRFTLEAATTVASDARMAAAEVTEYVANLLTKSLVTADVGGVTVHYRLLETTRAYALEKLAASSERKSFARRHAEYCRDLFRRAALEWEKHSTPEWLGTYGGQIDDVRAALDWAFSYDGDSDIGVALTIVAVPLWFQLSLMQECRRHVERAIAASETVATREARRDMELFAALGSALVYTNMGPAAGAAWRKALELAERLDDVDYKLRALWGLWVDSLNNGRFQEAVALGQQFYDAAAGSGRPNDPLLGHRMIGTALHFIGNQTDARQHVDRMLSGYVMPVPASDVVRYQADRRLTAHSFQARCLWLLGFPDQALDVVAKAVEEGRSIGHALSLCAVLGQGACPVAVWSGDIDAAERYLQLLLDCSASHALGLWHTWGAYLSGVLHIRRGNYAAGLQELRSLLLEPPEIRSLPRYLGMLGELAKAMGRCGEVAQAEKTIEDAIDRADRREERWCLAELMRIRGELVLQGGAPNAIESAAAWFRRSLDLARSQSALSWELRTATSLARLQADQRNAREARQLLEPVYARFTEGFGTADLKTARQLLGELE